jgi:tetratricopeptide (TPR) repeat protein
MTSKGMLAEHLQQCDAVICLIGTAYGSGPHDPITKTEQSVHGLKDPRTKDRIFSYTQLELLIARDLGRPIYTFFIEGEKGDDWLTAFAPEPLELAQRQQAFITEFAKDGRNTYGTFSQWDQPADPTRSLKRAIEAIKFEITVLAGKPANLPYTSLGTLFKGRDEFLAELRQHLTAEGPVIIKGKRTIHGMGGVGKTRTAIEYAWKHADDYHALLFISADTPEALHQNLAALCGPLVLNLPEQNEKEQELQLEATLRWLRLHPGWVLIIDNVDTDEAAEEVKALLSNLTTGHVLITSRISDWTGNVISLDLDVLSEAASIAFLNERTHERRPKRDDDGENVAELVELLDCLALALEQAGAHISSTVISYADYIALWESHRITALTWHDEEKMKYPRSLAITYETSVAQLSDGAKALFRILSWFAPDPVPRNLLESRPDAADQKRFLGELDRLHLARYLGDGKAFSIHRLNQEITRQQQNCELPKDLERSVEWLEKVIPDNTNDIETWTVAIPLSPHAIAAATSAIDRSIPDPSCRVIKRAALLFQSMGNYSSSEKHIKRAIEAISSNHGENAQIITDYLYDLAEIFRATNRPSEAEAGMLRALALDEINYGNFHSKVARDLSVVGLLQLASNRLSEAEKTFRRALEISERCQGGEHPDVARDLINLSLLLREKRFFHEAEPLIRRAIEIDERVFGEGHPEVAVDLEHLASLHRSTGRIAEAEDVYRRCVSIAESRLGTEHPSYAAHLCGLARLLMTTDRITEAEFMFRRVLDIDITTYGKMHPHVAADLGNLAQLLQEKGDYAEAEALYREALEIDKACFCVGHIEISNDLINLGDLLQAVNRLSEADECMREALSIREG